jgi:hypothetical protein
MKAAEILRKLADVIEKNSTDGRPTNSMPHAELTAVEVDDADNTESSTPIPPLQAKLELLKKSMGMDNAYDSAQGCGCEEPCDCAEQPDELDVIKQNAGIPVIAVSEMADDEPYEG